ncbi:MAG: DUF3179 domain-containing (seleno)protein [Phycisphaerales bacterium]|nr:DUF3179 domain-containing (seleno)protein [Phycisphaerales bacterium]
MTDQQVRLTFKDGGWVLVMTGIVLLGVIVWALAPAIFRLADLPPGDNKNIETYEFNLSELQLERSTVVPSMRHRNMSPVVLEPQTVSPEEIQVLNNSKRDPLLVSKDLVVGVEINGESRAYPLHFLHVHEIVNDTLGGIDIAVFWHWPSGHVAVFERMLNGTLAEFANSGLSGNGGMLFYPLSEIVGNETLYAALLEKSVTGNSEQLTPIPHSVVSWKVWHEQHPNTTSLAPDAQMKKRYRKASPELYFRTEKIHFPANPMPDDRINPKTPVVSVRVGDSSKVFSLPAILEHVGDEGTFSTIIGDVEIDITAYATPLAVSVKRNDGIPVHTTRSLWFAWFANHPETTVEPLDSLRH